ncbi:TonB C-terminal domain-containing protein, partial [Alphaproteobacteria bacterium]|nr:TonB C-terminal domain-containing protein [Alphaproteobacteria bacterium]
SENFEDEIKKSSIDNKIKELANNKLLENTTEIKKEELSLIEKIILKQIDENWTRPPGIKIVKNLNTKLIIKLDSDGNVIKVVLHKQTQADILNNSTLQPYLDSALRAVKKASPIEGLPKDSYSNWREIVINFKPVETR